MGGKLFAVIVIVIALASAVPIINHTFLGASVTPPEDISTHGAEIDKQLDETMVEAGLSFLAAQLVLGFFVWQFGGRKNGPLKNFPGGAKYLIIAAIVLVGAEAIALGAMGTKAWGKVYFEPASADALPIQVQAGQFAFYFRYAGPDGKFGGVDDYGDRLTVSSREELVKFVYPPGEFGYEEPDWREFDDLYVAPCVSLPDEVAS